MSPSRTILRTASGSTMNVLGRYWTNIVLGGRSLPQSFYVVSNLNASAILGRDFMYKHKVDLSLGRMTLTVAGGRPIKMCSWNEVNNIVRLVESVNIPPHHIVTTQGKYQKTQCFRNGTPLQWYQITGGFLDQEPGLVIVNGLSNAQENCKIPITIFNQTSKHFTLNRGNVVARIEQVENEAEICEITSGEIQKSLEELNFDIANLNNLNEEQRTKLRELLEANSDVFAKHEWDLGQTKLVTGSIDTGDSPPARMRPYRTPLAYRGEVRRQVNDMLKAGLISPSNSNYAAPVVCVPKRDGGVRLTFDYRKLNQSIKEFSWPMPTIDDILGTIGGSKYFSSLDFLKSYMQIPMDSTKDKTAFITSEGLYHSNVLPFGLNISPAIFQKCMSFLLNGHQNAIAYLDDIIVHSRSFGDHLIHLQEIFDRIRNANLKLKLSKCDFVKEELLYLGHYVSAKGIRPDPEKVKVIQDLSPPSNVKMIRSFIGMASFYRRYIPNFSKLSQPLTELTRKNVTFSWNEERQRSFDALKEALTEAPILKLPEMGKPFALYTDSSDYAIGAVLCQFEDGVPKPVHYLSHQLSKTQRKWPILEKECYSIVYALEKFRVYLEGSGKFPIYSDHKPLSFIESADNKNAKLQRWATKISSFGGQIVYIKGKDNVKADFLSRLEERDIPIPSADIDIDDSINVINTDRLTNADSDDDVPNIRPTRSNDLPQEVDITKEQDGDRKLAHIKSSLASKGRNSKFAKTFVVLDHVLYHVDRDENLRLVVPTNLRVPLIKDTHEGFMGAHLARDKTWEKLYSKYFWKGMTRDIYDQVDACMPCKKQNTRATTVPLQEVKRPDYPFQHIAVDTAGYYRVSEQGNRYCFTVSDLYSGWIECFAIPDKSAASIAKILVEEIFRRFSWPRYLTSDNGSEFCNEILASLTKLGNVHHIKPSPYHPQANGRAERAHRTMVSCLSKIEDKCDWDLYLPSFCAAYNTSVSSSSKYSPFYLVFHRDPLMPLDTIIRPREIYYGDDFLPQALERMHVAQYWVKRRLEDQASRNKAYLDDKRHAQHVEFKPGDPVYVRNHQKTDKLDDKWLPYHRILRSLGKYSYEVQSQVSGKTKRIHAHDLSLAKDVSQWKIPDAPGKRSSRYVVQDDHTSDGESVSSADELEDVVKVGPSRPTRVAKTQANEKLKALNMQVTEETNFQAKLAKLFHSLADELL